MKKKYIICTIFGGFGNQILQYFFSASLSKYLQCELILDVSFSKLNFNKEEYLKKNPNTFFLKNYNINNIEIKENTIVKNFFYLKLFKYLNNKIFFFYNFFFTKYRLQKFFYEKIYKNFNKKIDFKKFETNSYYFGYWQKILTSKYFDKNLINSFYYIKNKNKINKYKKLITKKTIAIHIRGKDYNLKKNQHRVVCDENYYTKSINYFKDKKNIFHIYTDDVKYAKKLLKNKIKKKNHIYIKNNKMNDLEEFELLRNYKYYIISNSTYSLAASFLSRYKKVIIAPKYWFIGVKNNLLKSQNAEIVYI
jgi:hypothetical protein